MEEKKHEIIFFGLKIKQWRKRRKMTQDILSKKADIPYTSLAKIESGVIKNPSLRTSIKIASALNISLDELIK
mgnify:CR=1 FL=1